MDRTRQISSAHSPILGSKSENSRPEAPNFRNVRGLAIKRAESFWMKANRNPFKTESGRGCPANSFNFGFGSNRSTWLLPPDRKKKMQFRARGEKCGRLGVKGLIVAGTA